MFALLFISNSVRHAAGVRCAYGSVVPHRQSPLLPPRLKALKRSPTCSVRRSPTM
jgi:hypothetical protein